MPILHSRLCGLIGKPVGHSLSPLLHTLAALATREPLVYVPFLVEPERLPAAIEGLRALRILGANVTIPHKESVRALVDELSPDAAAIGAVNTIARNGDRLIGLNTDHLGFRRTLEDLRWEGRGATACLFGSGGSARAAAFALGRMGLARVVTIGRNAERTGLLTAEFAALFPETRWDALSWSPEGITEALGTATLAVNCTPIGLDGAEQSFVTPETRLLPGCIAFDLLYDPPETPFLAQMQALGARCVNGFGMLVYQAWESFAIWTGKRPGPALNPRTLSALIRREVSRHDLAPSNVSTPVPLRGAALARALGGRMIFLTGFMGAGKTTVGRLLAAELGWAFVDLDELIERRTGQPIAAIFQSEGEASFRTRERESFVQTLPQDRTVVALGGGAYVQPGVAELCRAFGLTLWLRASWANVAQRLTLDTTRPLWDEQRARALLTAREALYAQADAVIGADEPPESVVDACQSALARAIRRPDDPAESG